MRPITEVLDEEFKKPEILSLSDVSIEEGDKYLKAGMASDIWPKARAQFDLTEFLSSPFTLRLLERALPTLLMNVEMIDLDRLYEWAIQSMLLRDGRVPKEGIEPALQALERFGLEADSSDRTWTSAALACGILAVNERNRLGFQHRSVAEFFWARALFRQLAEFDASVLARLDLIGGYNICRFLVPRLRRGFDVVARKQERYEAHWVNISEFRSFCDETGWRRGVGYGYHPYRTGIDAPPYATDSSLELEARGFDPSGRQLGPATRISWFDALQYCRWSGRKMLSCGVDSVQVQVFIDKPRYTWGSDWHDERKAYVTVLEIGPSGNVDRSIGVNPDFRSESIGLAVTNL